MDVVLSGCNYVLVLVLVRVHVRVRDADALAFGWFSSVAHDRPPRARHRMRKDSRPGRRTRPRIAHVHAHEDAHVTR